MHWMKLEFLQVFATRSLQLINKHFLMKLATHFGKLKITNSFSIVMEFADDGDVF